MRGAFKPLLAGEQKLATPDGPVETVTGAIPRNAKSGRLDFILGHARKHVRPVMLHGMNGRSRLSGIFGGKIIGMTIAGDEGGRGFVKAREVFCRGTKSGMSLAGGEVADVLADENFRANT